MLYLFTKPNTYMDSIALMLLSDKISSLEGVRAATVMMGTKANVGIMKESGFGAEGLDSVRPNDMVAVIDTDDEAAAQMARDAVQKEMSADVVGAKSVETVKTWRDAREQSDKFDVCLISVPGEYAADEARRALEMDKHVFMFSDNVTLDDEKNLKTLAHEKGLLMMGPDCGTSIINGVPFGFANEARKGGIGIIGASGTGIQEISVQIHRLGAGVSHAIGTGGRDLNEEIGARCMLDAIDALAEDEKTRVMVVLSKPPAKSVRETVLEKLRGVGKPVVLFFLGEKAENENIGNICFASTTDQAAGLACSLSGIGAKDEEEYTAPAPIEGAKLIGLFSGGTLACEAAFLAARATGVACSGHAENGKMLDTPDCEIIDLGDDCYTRGKPHPMIDGSSRNRYLLSLQPFERPTVLLLDVVLGYGAQSDPSSRLAKTVSDVRERAAQNGVRLECVANLLGTDADPQGLYKQREILEQAGIRVFLGNEAAIRYALNLIGKDIRPAKRDACLGEYVHALKTGVASERITRLINSRAGVLNVGLAKFADEIEACGKRALRFDWKPAAQGDKLLRGAVDYIDAYRFKQGPYATVDEANQAVVERIQAGAPYLVDVIPACEAYPELSGKMLLHAGPPMSWEDMSSPMRGSCVGAALFEEWVQTEEEARAMFENGEARFMPCHHAGFVGPMGGITSAHMPVLKVENRAGGNVAYCTMNEGIGAVLRFGAYSPEVVNRLRFMRDVLGPILSAAIRRMNDGLALNAIIARAIAMGDEFHQRNIAASMVFLKEIAPIISELDWDQGEKVRAIKFLADTDQFFLNIMMATAKSVMDYAATIEAGTVVTVMTRNGKDFGVRISGMGKTWFTGPVNTPLGLYFSGYHKEDGNPDMGDSAITETYGVGGMAMIAAPAVTRFVGTGGFYDALSISDSMCEITIGHNNMFQIPNWDFKGIVSGIDARKVVMTGITPVINTGIAHKKAGLGQIGAGTVHPPMECFREAILTYARKLGFTGE